MKKPELLAPAGSLEALKTAVKCGADAVYFGSSAFSARAYAENIGQERLADAVEYAHLRGVRLYAAINTMLTEGELPKAVELAHELTDVGIDAAIVADIGLASVLARELPELELHASTQMCVHSMGGLKALKSMGVRRAVLSRELSAEEAERLAGKGVELEVFVHGALCSGVSGVCMLSSCMGPRSGNRGTCAQPCRKAYELAGSRAYHLSMSELCTMDSLHKLSFASALKIEGRMRRPEYVAAAVSAYRAVLDGCGDIPALRKELMSIFNRGGFTGGFIGADSDVTYIRRPNNTGVRAGVVTGVKNRRASIKGDLPLFAGDSLEFVRPGASGQADLSHGGLTIGYADAVKGGFTVPAPPDARAGDIVYRTGSAHVMERMRGLIESEDRLPVSLLLTAAEGKAPMLRASHDGISAAAVGSAVCDTARSTVDSERLRGYLRKGDDTFYPKEASLEIDGRPFISAAAVNALRREALARLKEAVLESLSAGRSERAAEPIAAPPRRRGPLNEGGSIRLWALGASMDQVMAALDSGAAGAYLLPAVLEQGIEQIAALPDSLRCRVLLALPPFLPDSLMPALPEGIGVLAGSIGQIAALGGGRVVHGDIWLNMANSQTAAALRSMGAEPAAVSMEIDARDIGSIGGIEKQVVVYGRRPAMTLVHCPVRKAVGCASGLCRQPVSMTGEKGEELTLLRITAAGRCQLLVLADTAAYGDIPALARAGASSVRLGFYTESPREVRRITAEYRRAIDENRRADVSGKRTHIERGVT